MIQFLYKNIRDGEYKLYPVPNLSHTNTNLRYIGEISIILSQRDRLAATNEQLEFQLRQHLIS